MRVEGLSTRLWVAREARRGGCEMRAGMYGVGVVRLYILAAKEVQDLISKRLHASR